METSGKMVQESETRIATDFPQDLFEEIQKIAGEENWPLSQAVVLLARMGAKAQREAAATLAIHHKRLLDEKDPATQDQIGHDIFRSVFGSDPLA